MRRASFRWGIFCAAGLFLLVGNANAQLGNRGNWNTAGNNPQRTGWQIAETKISKDTAATKFRFLWKLPLEKVSGKSTAPSEPILVPGFGTANGFKDMAIVGGANSVYAVDYELGTLFWEKHFDVAPQGPTAREQCGPESVSVLVSPPRPSAPGGPWGPKDIAVKDRYLGAESRGSSFSVRPVYVLTADGYLHGQILSTGDDYAASVKFLPSEDGALHGMNKVGTSLYAVTGVGCGSRSSGVWLMDLGNPAHKLTSFTLDRGSLLSWNAPAIGTNGTVYVLQKGGTSAANAPGNGVVALDAQELTVRDWYAAEGRPETILNAAPIVFSYKGRDLIAAPGKDASLVLLDSKSLGGADHRTPLAQTFSITKSVANGSWGRLATWRSEDTTWVLASIWGPVEPNAKFGMTNGNAPHGSIVAFKVAEQDGQVRLIPAWISRDLIGPAPPVIANGVVLALSSGNSATHATLYLLDAETGKELYSSGDTIRTYAHLAGMAVGGGHVLFTTHDDTLYSFGMELEH